MSISDLPAVNAGLNSLATLLILGGWWSIATHHKRRHIAFMVAALITSAVFLASYLYYHFNTELVTKFTAEGLIRPIYFTILISHILLAFAVPPLVILTVIPAIRARFDKHRRIARWTLPIWLYVSVTGVLVYFMLYQWFPPVKG